MPYPGSNRQLTAEDGRNTSQVTRSMSKSQCHTQEFGFRIGIGTRELKKSRIVYAINRKIGLRLL